jgi:chemotaxis protein CheX
VLKASHVNPLIQSTFDLFATMLGSTIRRTGLSVSDQGTAGHDIVALIGLSGPVRGTIGIGMPRATALAAVTQLMGMEAEELDDTVSDAIGELVNMIAGGAKAKLSEAVNTTLDLTLPTVIHGAEYEVLSPSKALWLEIPFDSDLGPFALRISFANVPA